MKTPALREPPVHVVLIDNQGIVLDVSTKAGRSAGNSSAVSLYPVGQSYFDHCEGDPQVADVQMLLKRRRSLISFVLPSRPPKRKEWFVVLGVPVSAEIGSGAVLMHVDIAAWLPEARGYDGTNSPVTLSPNLIQDTLSKALVQKFTPGFGESAGQAPLHPDVDMLSPRQREVLMLLGAGKSNAEIAEALDCSLNTVKRHVTAVLQKLRLPNRTLAAMLANRLGLTEGRS